MTPELQKQIEQEAKKEAEKLKGRVPIYRYGYEAGHCDAAEKYAALWQAAEAKAERYEKALREIYGHAGFVPHKHEMITIAREALTTKTSTDE